MIDWLRRAGRGRDETGANVTWSVAEGRRGRRWREVRESDGAILSSLLLETDPDGRFSHLELSTPAGLLTLHPEGDGTIHGNSVTASGVRHVLGLPWADDGVVVIDGSAVARAAAAQLVGSLAASVTVLRIGAGLEVTTAVEPVAAVAIGATAGGLPVLEAAEDWPLEEAASGPGGRGT